MGYGDELLGSGMARGAAARGKRIAFGDGKRIIWSAHSHEIYRNNPNVAPPGSEGMHDLEWIRHYRGNRLYARSVNGRWIWNMSFSPQRGEVFFSQAEIDAVSVEPGFILIEPSVKNTAINKQWPKERYAVLAQTLIAAGHRVAQFTHSGPPIASGVGLLRARSFREALVYLRAAALYIGPEGGLHHGAAAVGKRAVVIFGGFISPKTTGYPEHINLFTGGTACGVNARKCPHCVSAMNAITVPTVVAAAYECLERRVSV